MAVSPEAAEPPNPVDPVGDAGSGARRGLGSAGGDVILAYGGLVWDRDASGRTVVAAVHRPRYDDWSFPKGKAERAEEPSSTARREVEEETGLACSLGLALGEQAYLTAAGPKVVGYWAMQPLARRPRPADDEVDAVVWWTLDEARRKLTYPQDRQLLERFAALHPARRDTGGSPPPGA